MVTSYCSDFRYESNRMFVLGLGFFLQKGIVVLSLNFKSYFTCDHFSESYGGLKIAILANLGQLTRDIFGAINA